MLLGLVWDMLSVLFGLLDIDTKPESLLVPGLELSPDIASPSPCRMTGLTPSKDFNTEVEVDCSVSLSISKFFSELFFGVDVVLVVWGSVITVKALKMLK